MRTNKEIAIDIVRTKIKGGEMNTPKEQIRELIRLSLETYKLAIALDYKLEQISKANDICKAELEREEQASE